MNDTRGQTLRAERVRKGWSQSKLARETGLTDKTISRLETDSSPGDLTTWERIAEALEVPVAQFIGIAQQEAVVYESAYPSLDAFLAQSDAAEDERDFLASQRFKGGDPGATWWAEQLTAYRRQQRILELERAAGRTDRRRDLTQDPEHQRDDVLPLKRRGR